MLGGRAGGRGFGVAIGGGGFGAGGPLGKKATGVLLKTWLVVLGLVVLPEATEGGSLRRC